MIKSHFQSQLVVIVNCIFKPQTNFNLFVVLNKPIVSNATNEYLRMRCVSFGFNKMLRDSSEKVQRARQGALVGVLVLLYGCWYWNELNDDDDASKVWHC